MKRKWNKIVLKVIKNKSLVVYKIAVIDNNVHALHPKYIIQNTKYFQNIRLHG